MNLYPLKFKPILKNIIWGGDEIAKFKKLDREETGVGESWEISAVEDNISVIENGKFANIPLDVLIDEAKEKLVGKKNFDKFGNKFPLLIKFIDARDDLSIQVHPDDKMAQERHNSFGKTEMWYIVKAEPEAFIFSGFKEKITPEQYVEKIADNTFTDALQKHYVQAGDVYFMPAGRVHAIGSGCFVAEIQQTSNITYRIYDYNRKDKEGNSRELHTELAKDAIDYTVYDSYKTEYKSILNETNELVSCDYFTTNLLELDKPLEKDVSNLDSFIIYMCLEGTCELQDNKQNKITLSRGETILVPADTLQVVIKPTNKTKLLETFVR
jgi:mannose-6-phosphate isomerase